MFAVPTPRTRSRHRSRRKLKKQVYVIPIMTCMLVLVQYYQFASFWSVGFSFVSLDDSAFVPAPPHPTDETQPQSRIILQDSASGRMVSRNASSHFSDFLWKAASSNENDNSQKAPLSREAASQGRERLLEMLATAGLTDLSPLEIATLPKWEQIVELYGKDPVIIGMGEDDSTICQTFRNSVPPERRFLGILGMFNSGSTAFGISLQANCRFPNHPQNMSNDLLTDVNGMLDQHPSAKHKMATELSNHTIHEGIPKQDVLGIVLVRDPYYWMQSMCKQGYGARWDHNSQKHCPNLVPNDFDRRRFKPLKEASSVPVWMGKSPKSGPSWDSLVHYWNAWYHSYVSKASLPRILIRFEDTLFHEQAVMKAVCDCGGGQLAPTHKTLLDEAKWHHKQAQNNRITAMIRYGTDLGRFRNMTEEDRAFARSHLDPNLLDLFHYRID